MITARQTAFSALKKVQKSHSYSNLAWNSALERAGLSAQDRAFAARLFYGVLERQITLDAILQPALSQPLEALSQEMLIVLRLGVYQLYFMETEPFAAVNETVNLAKQVGQTRGAGLVNAVLRRLLREGKPFILPDQAKEPNRYLAVAYSCPVWLVDQLVGDYGLDWTRAFLQQQLEQPPVALRVNTLRCQVVELCQMLLQQGFEVAAHPLVEGCILAPHGGNLADTDAFRRGLFHLQDVSSQLCAAAAAAYQPPSVLDACAAPGGKSFTIAQMTKGRVPITSCDLHPKRVGLIASGAERLGLQSIRPQAADASRFQPSLGKYGLVLCDVPCSGFGVMRRKPEIKYKPPEQLKNLPKVQQRILDCCSGYVAIGGVLLYSTCTCSKRENEDVTLRFLQEHSGFEPCALPNQLADLMPHAASTHQVTFSPADGLQADGFYLCAMKRRD